MIKGNAYPPHSLSCIGTQHGATEETVDWKLLVRLLGYVMTSVSLPSAVTNRASAGLPCSLSSDRRYRVDTLVLS